MSRAKPSPDDKFYILSLKWSQGDLMTWWRPENKGYTCCVGSAGIYTRAQIEAHPSYYDNRFDTLAVAVTDVKAMVIEVVNLERETIKKWRHRRKIKGKVETAT